MKHCPNPKCNETDHSFSAIYCHRCGTRLRKYNILKWIILVVIIALSGLFGYSLLSNIIRASADGKMLAETYNNCQKSFVESLQLEADQFVKDFDYRKYKNKTREDVTCELIELLGKRKRIYELCCHTVQDQYNEQGLNYRNRPISRKVFCNSFEKTRMNVAFDANDAIERTIKAESVQSCLSCLLPKRPEEEQVSRDLIGHKLKGTSDNPFFNDSWRLLIENNTVKKVDIVASSYKDDRWIYWLNMTVKEGGHHLSVRAEIIYELDYSKHNWKLVDVITQHVSIVQTTTYSNAISISYSFDGYYYSAEITNKNESPLLLGVDVWMGEERGWNSQKITLDVDKKRTIHCGIREDGETPLKIVFVEKA